MAMISIIIIDDEANARELLASLVSDHPGFEVISLCSNVDSAYMAIAEKQPDAILLDIQMPGKDGFALIGLIQTLDKIPEIIFVTAWEKFAIQAIKNAAFDYLLKPVKKEELRNALCRLRLKLRQEKQKTSIDQVVENIKNHKKIRINDRHGFHLINPDEIVYIHAEGSYCQMILSDDREITVSMNIGKLTELLEDDCFVKISRSCIININYLVRVDRKNQVCELKANKLISCNISKPFLKKIGTLQNGAN